jgi:protein-L-isoaspartate O-methyltransferase
MTTYTATYSPDDDKIRLYASSRLDAETYARVKAAGFKWAPKQDLFFAIWGPSREDLATELAGEIDDDDSSLVDRAEERADRFEGYSDNRMKDAESARKAVDAIADGIPLGQPILVGHHSEKHARRDAKRIESGMRKAVKMWETSKYWTARAAGALHHAKYKELPGVRHRRIKTLEADKRRVERSLAESERFKVKWFAENITAEQVGAWLEAGYNYDMTRDFKSGAVSAAEVVERVRAAYTRSIAHSQRCIAHYENRLAYETAMLAGAIGVDPSKGGDVMGGRFDFKPGGKILTGRGDGEWLTILRVNKAGGAINSLTTAAPASVTWSRTWKYGVEKVRDYQAPTEELAAKVKAANKLPPICNYPGEGFREMTEAEWKAAMARKWSDFPYYGTIAASGEVGRHRVRQMPAQSMSRQRVFITDAKRVDPPKLEPMPESVSEAADAPAIDAEPETAASQEAAPEASLPVDSMAATPMPASLGAAAVPPVLVAESYREPPAPANDPYQVMRDSLRAGGVKVTVAAQLFPTPRDLAFRVAEEADLQPGHRILEPSAGTGRLIDAAALTSWEWSGELVAVESHPALASALLAKYLQPVKVRHADFLECAGELGLFDRVLMNPPFADQMDVRHVMHAAKFLKPGGRLVAIMAAGVTYRHDRMSAEFRAFVERRGGTIEALPADSFKESGTKVNAVLVVFDGE